MTLASRRAAAAVVLALAVGSVVPAAGSAASASGSSCRQVRVVQRTAVRYDPAFDSRIVRTAHRGDRETVCLVANGRGERYTACGRQGYDWYLVRGGFIPDVCAARV